MDHERNYSARYLNYAPIPNCSEYKALVEKSEQQILAFNAFHDLVIQKIQNDVLEGNEVPADLKELPLSKKEAISWLNATAAEKNLQSSSESTAFLYYMMG
jgi:hypothetical protein